MNSDLLFCRKAFTVGLLAVTFAWNARSQFFQSSIQNSRTNIAKVRTNTWYEEHGAEGRILTTITIVYPPHLCCVGLFGHTNIMAYKPLMAQAFDVHVFDSSDKPISKTREGRKFGQPLKPDRKLVDGTFRMDVSEMYGHSRMLHFDRGDGNFNEWEFDLLKSFHIKKPGEYRLQMQVRLFTKDTNGVFQPFILPPVETKLNILESDLK